jgi:hypothetical protein
MALGRVMDAAGDLPGDVGLQELGQRELERGELKDDAADTEAEAKRTPAAAEAESEQADRLEREAERREG